MKIKNNAGFTLIELLVVIAILGVLAGAVLIAINPLEQLARGRDAGRRTTVQQLGSAVQAYYTSQGTQYPAADTNWMQILHDAGELKALPTNPDGGAGYLTGCNSSATLGVRGYCYNYDTSIDEAIVYTRAESKSGWTAAGCVGERVAWIVWSSAEGKTGLVCMDVNVDPPVNVTGLK